MISPYNYTRVKNKKNEYIVIHYTGNATDTAINNARYFNGGKRGASAHCFVDDNSIYQVVEFFNAAWSVGKLYDKSKARFWGVCKNNNSINIEMCSRDGRITDQTVANTVELVKYLMGVYGIPASHVIRHYDVCGKSCPGWEGWIGSNDSIWRNFKYAVMAVPTPTPTPEPKPNKPQLTVDGIMGHDTTVRSQQFFGTYADGIISRQSASCAKYMPGIPTCEYNGRNRDGGSSFVQALQKWLGVGVDGKLGPNTIRAWQRRMGTGVDGVISNPSACIKAWQRYLNTH